MNDLPRHPAADIGAVEDRFFTLRNLRLTDSTVMSEATIAYETYGRLAPDGRNAILCTHGYTGSHHFAGRNPANGNQPGSWDGLIGPGNAIDMDKLFVVASNMLGSSFGSTNAGNINPADRRGLWPRFPEHHDPRRCRCAESLARPSLRLPSGRGCRSLLRRLPGVPIGGRLPRFHGRDRAGQHGTLGLGQYR
jgi:hypothetical protein